MAIESPDYLNSGQVTYSGLGSDVDWDKLIKQLVNAESFRVKQLKDWKEGWDNKISAFEEVSTSLSSLETSLSGMDSVPEFFAKTATSSDTGVLTAEASTAAEEGAHTVEVNQLAQNEIMVSKVGLSSPDAQVSSSGSSTFEYTYGSQTVSVSVPDGTTLDGLINIINSDADNPGVRADSIKKADGDYRLELIGMDQGATNTLSVSAGPDKLDSNSDATVDDSDFVTTQNAQNAQLKLDGFPNDGTYIERSSNSVDDLIKGLTLNLKDVGSTVVSVSNDDAAIKENIHNFVDQVNKVLVKLQENMEVNDSGEGSILTGNYGLQMVKQEIKDVLSSKGLGFDRNEDPITVLSSVGITTDTDQASPTFGQLVVDDAELDKALQKHPEEVAELFSANNEPETNTSDFSVQSIVAGTTEPGVYDVQYSVDSTNTITSATIDGETANIEGDTITATQGPAKGLALQINNLTQGDYSGSASLKEGKAIELKDALDKFTAYDGTFQVLEDNYQDIVDNIEKQIEDELKRLDKYERNLREKFAEADALIGRYNNMQSMLDSQIQKLDNSS